MAIIGFCGRQGSGKTLGLIREGMRYQNNDFKVFSNIKLNTKYFPDYTLYTLEDLLGYDENEDFTNCVLLIDEAHIFLDSRNSQSSKSKNLSYMVSQARKRNMSIVYTTQFLHQVEYRLRENTDIIIDCMTTNFLDVMVTMLTMNVVVGRNQFQQHKDWFFSKKFFDHYNTREVVKFSKLSKEEEVEI